MKLYTEKAFLGALLLLMPLCLMAARNPKMQNCTANDQSIDEWEAYGDNWSTWAGQWASVNDVAQEGCVTLFGTKTVYGKRITQNLTMYGAGTLNDVKVGDVFTAYGRVDATKCIFNQVDLYGCTKLEKCVLRGLANIYGLLDASECTLGSLSVCSSMITLTDSKVTSDITVKRTNVAKQVVELNNTIIEGSLIFEKPKGVVILRGTSCIKGDLIGGTIKKE